MKYGYARVSTKEQSLSRQEDSLLSVVDVLYEEKVSGKDRERPKLKAMLCELQPGDEVIVHELSRLGRSMKDLIEIVCEIRERGAVFRSLKEGIDLSSAYGELIFHLMGAFAEFERKQTLQRQAEGIASAKARGKKWGVSEKYVHEAAFSEDLFLRYFRREISLKEAGREWGSEGAFQYQYRKWVRNEGQEVIAAQ